MQKSHYRSVSYHRPLARSEAGTSIGVPAKTSRSLFGNCSLLLLKMARKDQAGHSGRVQCPGLSAKRANETVGGEVPTSAFTLQSSLPKMSQENWSGSSAAMTTPWLMYFSQHAAS